MLAAGLPRAGRQEAVKAGDKRSLKWKGLLPARASRPWKQVTAGKLKDKGLV